MTNKVGLCWSSSWSSLLPVIWETANSCLQQSIQLSTPAGQSCSYYQGDGCKFCSSSVLDQAHIMKNFQNIDLLELLLACSVLLSHHIVITFQNIDLLRLLLACSVVDQAFVSSYNEHLPGHWLPSGAAGLLGAFVSLYSENLRPSKTAAGSHTFTNVMFLLSPTSGYSIILQWNISS